MANIEQDTEGRGKYFLAAFLGPLIWGFMAVPIRLLKNWSAEDILHYRIILAVSLLWLFNIVFRKADIRADYNYFRQLPKNNRTKITYLTLISAILLFANWYTYIYCINSISVQAGAFAYILCPLITTAAGYLILKEYQYENETRLHLVDFNFKDEHVLNEIIKFSIKYFQNGKYEFINTWSVENSIYENIFFKNNFIIQTDFPSYPVILFQKSNVFYFNKIDKSKIFFTLFDNDVF